MEEEEEEERKKAYADLLLQAVRRHTMLPSDVMKSVLRYDHAIPFPFSPYSNLLFFRQGL